MPFKPNHLPAYKIPLSTDDQQRIGMICGLWAQIELAVDILIGCLASVPNRNVLMLMLDRKDMSAKVELLKSLAKQEDRCSPTLRTNIRRLCAAINHWGQKRNTAVHGLWTGGEGAGTVGMLTSKMRFMKPEELEDVADNLAIVSCHAFHVHWTNFVKITPDGESPWRDRLLPLVPEVE